ncbi:MAG: DUF1772 domain-containing protein [Rhodospirillaceae bacterium]|jgi:uncharacterized membrane protein|nr:DUF1772 domain-containing protein [Rhodospirillaceae bacterium]MBT6116990.1 DUF1772 domain-containing protein [Rhodospirillaceae bacterium]
MTATLLFVLALPAALGSALIGGLFFAFSVCVMPALDRLPAHRGMAAMQSINLAILNPLFFAVFFGTGALCAVLLALSLADWSAPHAPWLAAGGALYLVGGILVTMAFNVPLNRALAAASSAERAEDAALWRRYLSIWTAWNHGRVVGCLTASALLILALY